MALYRDGIPVLDVVDHDDVAEYLVALRAIRAAYTSCPTDMGMFVAQIPRFPRWFVRLLDWLARLLGGGR